MQNFRNFLPQDLVLAVFVAHFVFQKVRDLELVDTWFAFPTLVSCGVFVSILGNRVGENVEPFSKCTDCFDRKW